jgi:peptide chain release factor 2
MSELMRFGGIFDFDSKRERLEEVIRELESPEIWNNPEHAQALGRERAQLEAVVNQLEQLSQGITDLAELFELARAEDDEAAIHDVAAEVALIEKKVAGLEFRRMFSGKMDDSHAYLDIQSGSGGTEAQDWAEMLLRMYLRWGEHHGFATELIECSAGEVAGIKVPRFISAVNMPTVGYVLKPASIV